MDGAGRGRKCKRPKRCYRFGLFCFPAGYADGCGLGALVRRCDAWPSRDGYSRTQVCERQMKAMQPETSSLAPPVCSLALDL